MQATERAAAPQPQPQPQPQQPAPPEHGFLFTPGGSGTTRPVGFPVGLPGAPVDTARQCAALGPAYFYEPNSDTCTEVSTGRRLIGGELGSPVGEDGPSFFITPQVLYYDGPTVQRLARDLGGEIHYDVSNTEQTGTGWGISGGFDLPVNGFDYFSRLGFDATYRSVEGGSSGGSADGTADALDFPGLGVDGTNPGSNPNGYFLGFNGGLNAHTFDYRFTHNELALNTVVGTEFQRDNLDFYFGAGLRTGIVRNSDSYKVDVPGFALWGTYTTQTDAESLGGFVELKTSYAPSFNAVIEDLFVKGRVGFDVNRADSNVKFVFDSVALDDVQKVDVGRTYVTPRFGFELGMTFDVGKAINRPDLGWTATVGGGVEVGGGAPTISIPGGGAKPKIEDDLDADLVAVFRVQRPF